MKKYTIILLILVLIFLAAGCAPKAPATTAQMANPWTDHETLEEAEAAVGFTLDMPTSISGGFNAESFRTMDGDMKLLEVTYVDESDENYKVIVRKAKGEGQDISGVGEGAEGNLKIFDKDGYSWSLYAPNGYWGDSYEDFRIAIYE